MRELTALEIEMVNGAGALTFIFAIHSLVGSFTTASNLLARGLAAHFSHVTAQEDLVTR